MPDDTLGLMEPDTDTSEEDTSPDLSLSPSLPKPKARIDAKGLAADPQFKALPPHQQRLTFQKLLSRDPDYQALDAHRQNVVSNRVLSQFPDLPENKANLPKNLGDIIGKPYKWGGETPDGWDCSGLVKHLFGQQGVNLPRTAHEQYKQGQAVDPSAIQPGDAVFFKNTGGRKGITHVGVYVGDGKFVHAQGAKTGTVVTPLSSPHYASRFAGARRYVPLPPAVPTQMQSQYRPGPLGGAVVGQQAGQAAGQSSLPAQASLPVRPLPGQVTPSPAPAPSSGFASTLPQERTGLRSPARKPVAPAPVRQQQAELPNPFVAAGSAGFGAAGQASALPLKNPLPASWATPKKTKADLGAFKNVTSDPSTWPLYVAAMSGSPFPGQQAQIEAAKQIIHGLGEPENIVLMASGGLLGKIGGGALGTFFGSQQVVEGVKRIHQEGDVTGGVMDIALGLGLSIAGARELAGEAGRAHATFKARRLAEAAKKGVPDATVQAGQIEGAVPQVVRPRSGGKVSEGGSTRQGARRQEEVRGVEEPTPARQAEAQVPQEVVPKEGKQPQRTVFSGLVEAAVKPTEDALRKQGLTVTTSKEGDTWTVTGVRERAIPPLEEAPKSTRKPKSFTIRGEKITAAAYRDADGKIHYGPNHPEILKGIHGEVPEPFRTREGRNTPEFGFQTNKQEFVSREDAGPIATKAKQNLEDFEPNEKVHADQVAAQPGGETPISETAPTRLPEPLPILTKYGNVDARKPLPEGWTHVPEKEYYHQNEYNYSDALDVVPEERRYRAISGFKKQEAQFFPTSHYGKPATIVPVEDGFVMRTNDATKLRTEIARMKELRPPEPPKPAEGVKPEAKPAAPKKPTVELTDAKSIAELTEDQFVKDATRPLKPGEKPLAKDHPLRPALKLVYERFNEASRKYDQEHPQPTYGGATAVSVRARKTPLEKWGDTKRQALTPVHEQIARDVYRELTSKPKPTPTPVREAPVIEQPAKQPSDMRVSDKEPWQMTRNEWKTQQNVDPKLIDIAERVSDITRGSRSKPNPAEMRDLVDAGLARRVTDTIGTTTVLTEEGRRLALGHRISVVAAIREGKPVPPEVLADYPDLKPKPPAEPVKPTETQVGEQTKSKGHVTFVGPYEYFEAADGDLYRAPSNAPLDVHGYRMAARFESTAVMKDKAIALAKQAFGEPSAVESGNLFGTEGIVTGKKPVGEPSKPTETPSALEPIEALVDRLDLESVTSKTRAREVVKQAEAIAAKIEAGQKPMPGDAPGLPAKEYNQLVKALRDRAMPPSEKQGGTTLQMGVVPGLNEYLEQDLIPTLKKMPGSLGRVAADIRAFLSPASGVPEAGQTARIIRENAAELARRTEQATAALKESRNAFRELLRERPAIVNKQIDPTHPVFEFIDAIETGRTAQLKPEVRAIAQSLRSALDERVAQVQALGRLEQTIQDYFPHIWKDPKQAEGFLANYYGKRPMEGGKAFLKRRTIPTTQEGLAAGLEPVSFNPIDLTLLKIREMDRWLFAHRAFNEMRDAKIAKFVPALGKAPEGYRALDDRIAQVKEIRPTVKKSGEEGAPELIERGHWYAPADAARVFNNYLSPGLRGKPIYDAISATGNALNQAQLGLSAFHLTFTSLDASISKVALGAEQVSRGKVGKGAVSIAKGVTPLYAPIETILQGNKVLREYMKPGSIGGETAQIVDALQAGGGRVKMDTFYKNSTVESFWNALEHGNYLGAVLRAPWAALETAAKPLMEYVVPRQKLGVFSDLARMELDRLGPDATRDQVRDAMAKAWDSVDNRMGQLVYDNLFWHRTVKDLGLIGTRSLGWNLGTIRELGGAGVDVNPYAVLQRVKAGQPLLTHRMAYAVALPMTVALYGAVLTYLYTGQGPQELLDYFQPPTGRTRKNGEKERVQLPTYMRDVTPGLRAAAEGKQQFIDEITKQAMGKVHPLWQALSQMWHNKDFFGDDIRNDNDPLVEQAKQEAGFVLSQFIPFGFRQPKGQQAETYGELGQRIMGIMPAPRTYQPGEKEYLEAMRKLGEAKDSGFKPPKKPSSSIIPQKPKFRTRSTGRAYY